MKVRDKYLMLVIYYNANYIIVSESMIIKRVLMKFRTSRYVKSQEIKEDVINIYHLFYEI